MFIWLRESQTILSTCGSKAMNSRVGSCQRTWSTGLANSYKPVARRRVHGECTRFQEQPSGVQWGFPWFRAGQTTPPGWMDRLLPTGWKWVCPLGVGPISCSKVGGEKFRFQPGKCSNLFPLKHTYFHLALMFSVLVLCWCSASI